MNRCLKSRYHIATTVVSLAWTIGLAGCMSDAPDLSQSPATSQPAMATDVDPARATNEFWLAQKPDVSVSDANFDHLWATAETVSEDYLFEIDRRDRRLGLLTTVPDVSAQWFEVWRRELQTSEDKLISSVASHRRTIYWQFEHTGDTYTVTPRVIVERQVLAERRVSGQLSKVYFRRDPRSDVYGTPETDVSITLPQAYWYPVGRDHALEAKLVEKVLDQLQ